jgi:hypothetical protein
MASPFRLVEYEEAFYHITTRGNDPKNIYFAKSGVEKFKAYLKEAQGK